MKIIDISQMQGAPTSWAALKDQCDGVILRCGYRGYGSAGTLVKDKTFDSKLAGCKSAGIPVGCYFFSQAKNAAEGKEEAQFAAAFYAKTGRKMPLFIDSEISPEGHGNGRADQISKRDRTNAVTAFCKEAEKEGYKAGVYASAAWMRDNISFSKIKKYKIWVAYYTMTGSPKEYDIDSWYLWQYTSTGHVGAYGDTNLDISKSGTDFNWIGAVKKADAMLPSRGYWTQGDRDKRIGYIADFMRSIFPSYTDERSRGKYFGPYLAAAVKTFQNRTGLTPDGQIGPLTIKMLRKYGFNH